MANGMDFSTTLLGGGNMGGALLGGWIARGADPGRIAVVDPAPSAGVVELVDSHGMISVASAADAPASDVLVIAVKPQIMDMVLAEAAHLARREIVAVSVAAGVKIDHLRRGLGGKARIVRAMPNTPALIGRGITVACAADDVSPEQRELVSLLLEATGTLEWLADEALMDAVTALSGSGPAYVYYMAECMAKAGLKAGLPEELALTLARETVAGAGEMMHRSPDSPGQLREKVTSPNGTTAAALQILMASDGLGPLMQRAIDAAKRRSRELSEPEDE
jgi:pyrroline-5-carboxylate reductase